MSDNLVTVNLYHGGQFEAVNGKLEYVYGTITKFKRFDADYMSMYQIHEAAKILGYEAVNVKFWYKYPCESVGDRKPLFTDIDSNIRRLVDAALHFKEVDVLMEHQSLSGVNIGESYAVSYVASYEDEEFDCNLESYVDTDTQSDGHWSPGCPGDAEYDAEDVEDPFRRQSIDEDVESVVGFDEVIGDFIDVDIISEASNMEVDVNNVKSKAKEMRDEPYAEDGFPDTPLDTDDEWDNFDRANATKNHGNNDLVSDHHLSLLQEFDSREDFKSRLIKYSLSSGYDIKLKRSNSIIVDVICSTKTCGWRVYCSLETPTQKWVVKVYHDEHTCNKSGSSKILKIPDIAQLFLERIQRKPGLKSTEMRDEIKREHNLTVSRNMCSKARKKALDIVRGDYSSQFSKLWEYAFELTRSNPGTTVDLQTGDNMEFSRFYICMSSMKMAWRQYCRPVIGIDGCFLKWTLKGELLAAVGRDANNMMYPIAWAVVPVENKENWAWFIRKLKVNLALKDRDGFTIISYKQKGLLAVIEHELPKVEHRMCARHIYANLKRRYKEKKLKPLFEAVARSCNIGSYEKALLALKTLNDEAYRSVLGSDPKTWCRTFFKTSSHCIDDHNNLSEAFNATIKEARTKPIIHMLEDIRRQAMERIFRRMKASMQEKNLLTPVAQRHIERSRKDAINCVTFRCSEGQYEVDDCGSAYTLSLTGRSCSCHEWDLTGLPCRHAVCAIHDNRLDVVAYVSHYYLTSTWQGIYKHTMKAVNGEKLWHKLDIPPVQAPPHRKLPGRPKKRNRTKDPYESPLKKGKAGRHGRIVKCGILC